MALLLAADGLAWAQGDRPGAKISLVDRIVAVVNNEVITRFDLQSRARLALEDLGRRGIPEPPRAELERQVLERMITERVQLQFAKETAMRVDELELDRAVNRIAESNQMTLSEFRRVLERDAIPFEKFRDDIRNEILIQRLREREVDSKITVTESEIENYLSEQQQSTESGSEFRLGHIVLRVPEQASPEQLDRLRARAREVAVRARAGVDFAQLAATYSDAPDGLQGGDMGWRKHDQLPELFAQIAVKMKQGEVSEVLRSPAGFHVLKLIGRRSSDAPFMVEQNRVRHILAQTNEIVSEDDAKRKLEQLRERILNGVDFGELARLHSDHASGTRGGEVGWLYPGDTVPEFERVVRSLRPMEVSEPVKTPFGWHLIQVLERRTADMSSERRRLEARKTLRERKSDEAYQDWLRERRDRAYVEYRLDDR